jgi:DNA-binding NtrC family response regulator
MSGQGEHQIASSESQGPQFETIAKPFTRRALLAKIQAALQSKSGE